MVLNYNKNIEIREFSTLEELGILTKEFLKVGNIALSGGSTYLKLLKEWSLLDLDLKDVDFYPVDERVVDFESNDSNWGNSYRVFLSKYKKNRDHHYIDSQKYNNKLTNIKMNTVFLGVGDDGHTASLFNCESVFTNSKTKVIDTLSPKTPIQRISLTGDYIVESDNIVIVFYGSEKKDIVKNVLNNHNIPITTLLKKVKRGVIYMHSPLIRE